MNESSSSRRDFLRSALAAGAVAAAGTVESNAQGGGRAYGKNNTQEVSGVQDATSAQGEGRSARRPNILMICADQFRTDFVGANGQNPSARTPHIDALAARGTNFSSAVTNQPLCSPSRASFLTSMYATKTDVFRLGIELNHSLPTIASVLKQAGYSTHMVGKWHVSGPKKGDTTTPEPKGWIAPGPSRAGFDTWEGANIPELASHPYGGSYWDDSGRDIGFGTKAGNNDQYRVDFYADRACALLEEKQHADKPWLMFFSILEPHQQNDVDDFVPPHRYEGKYDNAFVPQDLRDLPGNWNSRLKGYYGCVQAVDDAVGKVVATLQKTGQLENTVIVFFSDHGCTFRTRLGEYKRNPADAAIRVPLIFAGPGFDNAARLDEVVSLLDMTPTLIDAAGVPVPSNMQGRSLKPLATDMAARKAWDSTAYIQISASMTARALRTKEWTYCAYDPEAKPNQDEAGKNYIDFCLFHTGADPYQRVNLIGREEYKEQASVLRKELEKRIAENGEPGVTIRPQRYFV